MTTVDYTPDGPTLSAFLHDSSRVKILVGPFGSGKTACCSVEIFRRCCEQVPGPGGVRHSRWLVVRNSYPRLTSTTLPSWKQWFDERFGTFNWTPPISQRLVLPLADGTVVSADIKFIALDDPDGQAALKGIEPTSIWFNEMSEIPRGIVSFALGRVGRYPAKRDGGPLPWYGVLGDTNNVEDDHWLARMMDDPPPGWGFHVQPGGIVWDGEQWVENSEAENLHHLPLGYYSTQMGGQTEDFVKVFLANQRGFVRDGRPVYGEYSDPVHCAKEPIAPMPDSMLYIGFDFGLTPAAVFAQQDAKGRWLIIDEMCAEDVGTMRFAELLGDRLDSWYGDQVRIEAWGDPAGRQRAQTDEKTCFQILKEHADLDVRPAPSQDLTLRREAVASCLNRLVDGKPGLLVSPHCKVIRAGFQGGYCYRRVRVSGDERYTDKPDKNRYSHPHDALAYLLSGAGEGRRLLGRQRRGRGQPVPQPRPSFSFGPGARRPAANR
jgi:hypothetical protein